MIGSQYPEPSEQSNLDFRPPTIMEENDAPPLVLQGRWEILEPLGQGGMGTVYKARDLRLSNRLCVVKKLRVDSFEESEREQALEFFDREARMLSNLKHPNIVRIYDRFREDENYYLVMEYVEGGNLEQLLTAAGEPFSEAQVTEWAIKICEVLHYLHSCRPPVIYRDLKPSNIMIDAVDGIKLVDFGIARPYRDDADNTHVISGGYSPPEQYWGGADTRSDIYALGATMHFLLTGVEPIALKTSSPKKLNYKLSDKMDRIVQKATAQYVELRYQYACSMREDLEIPLQTPLVSRKLSANIAGALCLVALIPLIAFGLSFLTNIGRNLSDSLQHGLFPTTSIRQQTENGLLSSSQKAVTKHPVIKTANKTETKIMPISSLMKLQENLDREASQSYSLDLAVPETRETMLTDPEGLKP